jgi:fumarate reductase subunit D
MTDAAIRRGDWRARGHAGWWAFALHRASGLALAVFLPLHFLVLGTALNGAAALDATLGWTEGPWVKASEVALVFLLAAHLGGGLRLLFVEFVGWRAALAACADRSRRRRRDALRAAVRAQSCVGGSDADHTGSDRRSRQGALPARAARLAARHQARLSKYWPRARPGLPAKSVLGTMIENIAVAERTNNLLCQDTASRSTT